MAKVKLTTADTALLRSYLNALDKLGEREPERLPLEAWDEIMPYVREHGEVPPAYVGRVGTSTVKVVDPATGEETGEETTGYYDLVWEEWNKEVRALHDKYHETIVKALRFALQGGEEMAAHPQVSDILQELISSIGGAAPARADDTTGELLATTYLPMLNGEITNEFMQLHTRGIEVDRFTKAAKFTTPGGITITIENYDKSVLSFGLLTKKILDAATVYLTDTNFYRGRRENITRAVDIPLTKFGEDCGWNLTPEIKETEEEQRKENELVNERKKAFKKSVCNALDAIYSVSLAGEVKSGRNKGDVGKMRILSDYMVHPNRDFIHIVFGENAAAFLVNSYIMQYPTALLRVSTVNAYDIGRKLSLHSSIDNNFNRGTNNTLSVKALTAMATNMPSIDAWQARLDEFAQEKAKTEAADRKLPPEKRPNRDWRKKRPPRNWKEKIKKPLESALDELARVGVLGRWEYRDPKTQETYTAETANRLIFSQYSRLMVDFVMVDPPDQTERRAAIEAKKEAKATDKKKKKGGSKGRKQKPGE